MASNYYIYAVILKDCPYSNAAYELLNSFNKIKTEFSIIDKTEKDNYKTSEIYTFPQIYLKRYNTTGNKLIGGYNDFKEIVDTFNGKLDKTFLNKFIKNKLWNKKTLLRLIELINLK
jgi:glutaredoxin